MATTAAAISTRKAKVHKTVPKSQVMSSSAASTRVNMKRAILFHSVDKFYDDAENFTKLKQLLARPFTEHKNISLRLLDYFLSIYAGENGVCVPINGKIVSFHDIYQARLSSNGKVLYDAFRRTQKLNYTKHGETIETTLGQLLFFRDIISYKVLDYVAEHLVEIKRAMSNESSRMQAQKSVASQSAARRCKRRSGRKCSGIYAYKQPVLVKFSK